MVQGNLKRISAAIPVKNESRNIFKVVKETKKYVDEVLIIDDNSTDNTREVAEAAGAEVIVNEGKGYLKGIKTGFRKAKGDIVVTLDGDGEHDPKEIPKLVKPILEGEADLILGRRKEIARPSERFLNWLTNFGLELKAKDSGTGFRALKRDLALKLDLEGRCTCGVFALEAVYLGARISEIPIVINPVNKGRKITWYHLWQLFYVLRWLLKTKRLAGRLCRYSGKVFPKKSGQKPKWGNR